MDEIEPIQALGYTYREAVFLYLVARASGYFLTRQFNSFIRRKDGAIAHALLTKLREREHVRVIDYGQRRFVFPPDCKTIYALVGIPDSQNRRSKSDPEVQLRLMALDYINDRLQDRFLLTPQEKIEFFGSLPSLSPSDLPAKSFVVSNGSGRTTGRLFVERYPISIRKQSDRDGALITFSYFDCTPHSSQSFQSFLQRYEPLLAKCPGFNLDYVTLHGTNFQAAQRLFRRRFGADPEATALLPQGIEHLVNYFRARQLWDTNDSRFQHEDLVVLRKGEALYTQPEHELLRQAWSVSQQEFEQQFRRLAGKSTAAGQLELCILEQSYPIFGFKPTRRW